MPNSSSQPRPLPSPDQVKALLAQNPARQPPRLLMWLLTGTVFTLIVLALTVNSTWAFLQLLLPVVAILIAVTARTRWVRQLESKLERAQELTVLRHWLRALRLTWAALPSLNHIPHLHRVAVALMAQCLHHLKGYDGAIVAYEHLIDQLPADHPTTLELRVQAAAAKLAEDQLADADDLLQRLRGPLEPFENTPLGASYKFARLLQQVRTNHFADAIESADHLLAQLRPLGVEAAYGHALMALCFHQRASAGQDTSVEFQSKADLWWSRATLLLPPTTLLDRFPELALVAQTSTPTSPPWMQ